MSEFGIWIELNDIVKEIYDSINELHKRDINEASINLDHELYFWNDTLNKLFKTKQKLNWVNIAFASARKSSPRFAFSDSVNSVMGETLTDLYYCITTGKNPVSYAVESDPESDRVNQCPSTRMGFEKIKNASDDEKIAWWSSVVWGAFRKRMNRFFVRLRDKNFSKSYPNIADLRSVIAPGSHLNGPAGPTKRYFIGDEPLSPEDAIEPAPIDSTDDNDTLSSSIQTISLFQRNIESEIQKSNASKSLIQKALQITNELFSKRNFDFKKSIFNFNTLSQKQIMGFLKVPPAMAARVLALIRHSAELTRKKLGLLSGARFSPIQSKGSGRKAKTSVANKAETPKIQAKTPKVIASPKAKLPTKKSKNPPKMTKKVVAPSKKIIAPSKKAIS